VVFCDDCDLTGIYGVVQGQVEFVGGQGGRSDGVGVCRRPWRRPESVLPAAMGEAYQVVRRS
jgi:hypothetical protein